MFLNGAFPLFLLQCLQREWEPWPLFLHALLLSGKTMFDAIPGAGRRREAEAAYLGWINLLRSLIFQEVWDSPFGFPIPS